MKFTNLCLNNTNSNINPPAGRGFFTFHCLLLVVLASPAISSEVLVTQIQGNIEVKLPGFAAIAGILKGTLLPNNVEITSRSAGSQYWVLCPGSDKALKTQPKVGPQRHCPHSESDKMRGSSDETAPFILLPNQSSLRELDRIIWSGPKDAEYMITLYRYNSEGKDEPFREWEPDASTYQNTGLHELILDEPIQLNFSNEETYKLEVENLDNSKSSAQFDKALLKPITKPSSSTLFEAGYSFLQEQQIEHQSLLGNLALSAYFVGMGLRSEAYTLLDKLQDSKLRTQAQLLKARIFYQPGVPEDLIIKQYGIALEIAVADEDVLSAFIACKGLFSFSPLMLSSDSLKYQRQIVENPDLSRYCPRT